MKYQKLYENLNIECESIVSELIHKMNINDAPNLAQRIVSIECDKFLKSKMNRFKNERLVVKHTSSLIGYAYDENGKSYCNIFTDIIYELIGEIDVIDVSYENLKDSFRTSILTGLYKYFNGFKGLSPENRYLVLYLLENNLLND